MPPKAPVKAKIDTSWMTPNKMIWIERAGTKEIFFPAILNSYDPKQATYTESDGKKGTVDLGLIYERAEPGEYDDMVDMEIINDAELLVNLSKRYTKNLIFTYVGPTLLVVNPFKAIPELISQECKQQYVRSVINKEARSTTPPHIYSIGAEAYKSLFGNEKNQAIIISGESGAGKTENAKLCMNMITMIRFDESQKVDKKQVPIEDKILSCNPILEAFGNAKTVRNNNSSRFGKYTRIYISKEQRKIKGAEIFNYLLEKSRLCVQGKGERNFHIFYHMLKGMSVEELEALHLAKDGKALPFKSINYVNTVSDVDGINDVKLFEEIIDSIKTLGLEQDRENIFKIVASVLHIGDLQFDESTLTDQVACSIVNQDKVKQISELLAMTSQEIQEALTLRQREIQKQKYNSPVPLLECIQNRDSWAKELYGRLFFWLVQKLNETIIPSTPQNSYIGLLDIYGFEVFEKNGFEQLMINYTNERLHQLYISYVFKGEEVVFKNENLEKYCGQIQFSDNQPIIDFLDKGPSGVFDLLDDACQVKGDDDTFLQKIRKTHKDPKICMQPKMPSNPSFIVVHTAKDVEYSVQGFRDKNMDEISVLTAKYSSNSGNNLVARLFPEDQIGGKKGQSLSKKIRVQMNELMKELTSQCDVHFVRCIKPNDVKKPQIMELDYTLQQIRYLGVLDSLKVRKQNYPFRRLHQLFYKEYGDMTSNPLYEDLIKKETDFNKLNQEIFKQYCPELGPELVLFGTSRIFIRIEGMIIFQEKYKQLMLVKNKASQKLQLNWKRYKLRKFIKKILRIVHALRKGFWNLRQKVIRKKKQRAARFIRAHYLQHKLIKKFKLYRSQMKIIMNYYYRYQAISQQASNIRKLVKIQNQVRLFLFRRRIQKQMIAKGCLAFAFEKCWQRIREIQAVRIQKNVRGHLARRRNKEKINKIQKAKQDCVEKLAAVRIQKHVRGFQVRRMIKRWNQAAFKIQGFVKMRWLSATFQTMRRSTLKIQRLIRMFLIKQRAKHVKSKQFEEPLVRQYSTHKQLEEQELFGVKSTTVHSLDQTLRSLSENDQLQDQYLSNFDEILQYDRDPQKVNQKASLFNLIIDLELLLDTSDYFQPTFAKSYKSLFQYGYLTGNLLQSVCVGSTHALCATSTGKVYSWGANHEGQLGFGRTDVESHKPALVPIPFPVDQVIATSFNSYVKCTDGTLLMWGEKCESLSIVDVPKIKQIACNTDNTYIVTRDGSVSWWGKSHAIEPLDLKIAVSQVSVGFNYVCMLTVSGQIFCKGENEHGQLGLGDCNFRSEFEQIRSKEKFVYLSCGLKHSGARTSLGKVYVWGWNQFGQLGLGDKEDRAQPTQLPIAGISQICCSRTSSVVLIENRQLQWCGSNSSITLQDSFAVVNLKAKAPCLCGAGFSPVRIVCSYSKSLSLITVTFLFQNNVWRGNAGLAKSTLATLTSRWVEENCLSVHPPYIESVAKYLLHDHMKKGQQTQLQQQTKGKVEQTSLRRQLVSGEQSVIPSRRSLENKTQKSEYDNRTNYLEELKEKIRKLQSTPESEWSADDQQLMLQLQTQNVAELLDNIL